MSSSHVLNSSIQEPPTDTAQHACDLQQRNHRATRQWHAYASDPLSSSSVKVNSSNDGWFWQQR
jgi:hypothetical protein